ncbi:MAG: hypothetical protein ABI359_11260 [Ginsengibacter sp.]
MKQTNKETQNWTYIKKILCRFFFSFFVFEYFFHPGLYVLISGGNPSVRTWFKKIYNPIYDYINNHILHLIQGETSLTINNYIFHLMAITIAIVATILWSVMDKRRKSYQRADFWLRHILKYLLAINIFSYGILKLLAVQMRAPDINALDTPLGQLPISSLMVYFMGSSSFYECFTGLVEVTAALLLVFPKTYVMGLMVLTGILINILMLNIGYDYFGMTHNVIAMFLAPCVYLLYPYLKSIMDFLFNKKQVALYKPTNPIGSKLYKPISILSAIIFIFLTFVCTRQAVNGYKEVVKSRQNTKTFNVITQTYNADTSKMVVGDKARWKYWIEYKRDEKYYLSILTMNDTASYDLLFQNDTIHKIIQLKPDGQSKDTSQYTFSYLIDSKKGEKILTDSLHKMSLVIKEFGKEHWELLKPRNKFFPFDF